MMNCAVLAIEPKDEDALRVKASALLNLSEWDTALKLIESTAVLASSMQFEKVRDTDACTHAACHGMQDIACTSPANQLLHAPLQRFNACWPLLCAGVLPVPSWEDPRGRDGQNTCRALLFFGHLLVLRWLQTVLPVQPAATLLTAT